MAALVAVVLVLWLLPDRRAGHASTNGTTEPRADAAAAIVRGPPVERVRPELEREPVAPTPVNEERAARAPEASGILLRVLDEASGEPLEGARVSTFDDSVPLQRETDRRGECRLPIPLEGDAFRVSVEHAGHFHLKVYYDRNAEIEVRLHRADTLRGRVLDGESGAPVPNVRLRFVHSTCKRCEPDEVRTDEAGRYELAQIPRGWGCTFVLDAEGYPDQHRELELPREGPLEVDFRLAHGIEVAGRVVDWESGRGIHGATVGERTADEQGGFHGFFLPYGLETALELRAQADGYCELWARFDLDRLRSGAPVELRLLRGAIVEGTVRDTEGAPIPGALVRLDEDYRERARIGRDGLSPESPLNELPQGWRLFPGANEDSARTDETGAYVIASAVPWTDGWQVRAFASGFDDGLAPLASTPGPTRRVRCDVRLERTSPDRLARVDGKVLVNGFGRTLAGKVHWSGPTRSGEGKLHYGEFWFDLEPGPIELRIEVTGLSHPLEGDTLRVEAVAGETRSVHADLRLPTATISGRVVCAPAEPQEGVSLTASCSLNAARPGYWGELHYSTKTDGEGRYTVEVPDWPSAYRVDAELAGAKASIEGVAAGASGVDLVLPRPGVVLLRAHVRGSDRPLALQSFELSWRRSGEEELERIHIGWPMAPDPEGWLRLELPSGDYDFVLRPGSDGQRYLPARAEGVRVLPREQEPVRLDLELVEGLTLVLRATADAGDWPADHRVVLVEAEHWDAVRYIPEGNSWEGGALGRSILQRFVHLDDERTWTKAGLAPGRYRFKCFPADLVIEPPEIELTQSTRDVEIRWRIRR